MVCREKENLTGVSDHVIVNNHSFRASATKIQSQQDIRDSLDFLIRDSDYAHAHNLSYAFRYKNDKGLVIENFESGNDSGVGFHMLKLLRNKGEIDVVVFLAHCTDGNALGYRSKQEAVGTAVSGALLALQNAVM